MKYLILENDSEFDSLNSFFDSKFGYPTQDGQTITYATKLLRNGSQIAIPIQDRCIQYLSEVQTSQLVTETDLTNTGWPLEVSPTQV